MTGYPRPHHGQRQTDKSVQPRAATEPTTPPTPSSQLPYAVNHNERDKITRLLVGRKVTKVDGDHLQLDDGTRIEAIGNEGCPGCSSGGYDLTALNTVDNVITRVEFDYQPEDTAGWYRIFVFADNQQINLMQFDGDDGLGFYGTGFELRVRPVRSCDVCGCTDDRACVSASGPCSWVAERRCSHCADWAAALTTEYGDGVPTFPFVEDENANITGFGHQDRIAFAAEVNRYDEVTAGEESDWTGEDINHAWVFPEPDGERLRVVTSTTVGAIPVTTLWGAR